MLPHFGKHVMAAPSKWTWAKRAMDSVKLNNFGLAGSFEVQECQSWLDSVHTLETH